MQKNKERKFTPFPHKVPAISIKRILLKNNYAAWITYPQRKYKTCRECSIIESYGKQ